MVGPGLFHMKPRLETNEEAVTDVDLPLVHEEAIFAIVSRTAKGSDSGNQPPQGLYEYSEPPGS
jgi:hypothetical protein